MTHRKNKFKDEYSLLLNNPLWQRKRLEIMQRDNFSCCICGSNTNTLNVHHRYYESDKFPWEYPDDCFLTVCVNCHQEFHDKKTEDTEYHTGIYCVCCHIEINNQNCSTLGRIGDIYRYEIKCDKCNISIGVI